jgi:hypothetical protein
MAALDLNLFIILAASVLTVNSIRTMYTPDFKMWSTRFMVVFQFVLALSLMSLLRSG